MGRGVVGLEPDRRAAGGHGPLEHPRRLAPAVVLETIAVAAQVPRIGGPAGDEVGEDRQRLAGPAHVVQQVGQLVGRLGPHRPRRRVVPHLLLARRGPELAEASPPACS